MWSWWNHKIENNLMLQLQIAVNLSLYSSVTCCFFRSTYTLKKKLNVTFVFLKNSIVNNNAKNESWKSNSRRGIIQWLKVVIYVQPHYSLNTPTQKNKLFVLKITIASWGAVIITFFSFSFFRSGFVVVSSSSSSYLFRSIYKFKKNNNNLI